MKRDIIADCRQEWEVTPFIDRSSIIYSKDTKFIGDHNAQRYWDRRYEYWPNFDQGICTDETGLFSVTPFDSAVQIARTLDNYFPKEGNIIVDFGCGVGGNISAFSRVSEDCFILGIDNNPVRTICAQRNSQVCNLQKVDFLCGDGFEILPMLRQSVRYVFSSPPWGGVNYKVKHVEDMEFDLFKFAEVCAQACVGGIGRYALMLPKKFPIQEAKRLAYPGTKMSSFNVTSGANNRIVARCFMYGLPK